MSRLLRTSKLIGTWFSVSAEEVEHHVLSSPIRFNNSGRPISFVECSATAALIVVSTSEFPVPGDNGNSIAKPISSVDPKVRCECDQRLEKVDHRVLAIG